VPTPPASEPLDALSQVLRLMGRLQTHADGVWVLEQAQKLWQAKA
jgi:hypothetical protein